MMNPDLPHGFLTVVDKMVNFTLFAFYVQYERDNAHTQNMFQAPKMDQITVY